MAERPDLSQRIVDRALELAAKKGWANLSLADIAAASKVTLARLYAIYPSRTSLLLAYARRIDEAVLAGAGGEEEGETTRDRLFDLIMRRFEAMNPHKQAIASILQTGPDGPLAAVHGAVQAMRSMAWTLEAAGVSSAGLLGGIRTRGLLLIYLSTLRVWLADDTPDMARTLSALDRALSRGERWAQYTTGPVG